MSGSHSSSDDSIDSRKRPPNEVLYSDSSPKRANHDDAVYLKVLIPSIAAGAVIGKSGEAIGKIQKEANAKVKISKQEEFYPGTTERVCLIIGSIDGVMAVHNYIMDRIMEKPDPNPHATCEGRLNVERHKQVKILVPNSTAGMVIGKGGQYIKEIKDQTGAYVQISQKSRDFNLLERCIIVAGDFDQTRAAIQLILNVIAVDPQSSSCPSVSYHDIRGPVASVYPTGSPYATQMIPCPSGTTWLTQTVSMDPSGASPMMTAVLPHGGSVDVSRTTNLSLYSTSPDLSHMVAFGGAGLTPIHLQPALSSPASTNELFGATLFGTGSVQPALSPVLDPNSAIATVLLAASLRPKSESESSTLLPQYPSQFRIPSSGLVGYQTSHQSASRITQTLPESPASSTVTSTASPSMVASMALAALSAAAAVNQGSSVTSFLPSAGSLFGMVQPSQTPTRHMTASQVVPRPTDPMSLSIPSPSAVSHFLFAGMTESGTGGTVAFQQSSTSPSVAQCGPQFGLYASQQQAGFATPQSLSTSPVGSYSLSKRTIEVPESIIGLILGPQGRSIVDLQAATNTVIQVSQKGVYVPGTQNRIVSLSGPQRNVQWAASAIEQLVGVEQLRRVPTSPSATQDTPPPATLMNPDVLPSVFLYPGGLPVTTEPLVHTGSSRDDVSSSTAQVTMKPTPPDDVNITRHQSTGC